MRKFLFYPAFILVSSIIMTLLLWAVYTIPVAPIRTNMDDSAQILRQTPKTLWYNLKVPGETIDKISDARMLNMTSILRVDTAYKDSQINPENYYVWWAPNNLIYSLNDYELRRETVRPYPRFWHGYLLFLKPLSLFLTLQGIRFLNLFLQLFLLLTVLYLICKRLSCREAAAYLTAVCFLNPVTSWLCLEYATDINIMLLASLWVLINKNPNDDKIFFITGAVTILFDFITFPLITLGIPLILHLALYQRGLKEDIKCIIKNASLWTLGYSTMWGMKWIIATITTDYNVIKEAIDNIIHRSYGYSLSDSVDISTINFNHALELNLKELLSPVALYYLSGFVIVVALSFFIIPVTCRKNTKALAVLLVFLMPFIWYSVLINHSVLHDWFTYRTLVIAVFALLMAPLSCLKSKSPNA